jgi:hypothetical protein
VQYIDENISNQRSVNIGGIIRRESINAQIALEEDDNLIDFSEEMFSEHAGIVPPVQRESAWEMKGFVPGLQVNSENRSLRQFEK